MKLFALSIVLFILLSSFFQTKPSVINKASLERGKKVYENLCIACHQLDGGGVPNMNPTLIKTKWVLGDKKALIKIVLKGLKGGEIEIDGDTFSNIMPPQQETLTDLQIADVLTYVRNSFGNKASGVTVAEVKGVRGKKLK
ncbi:MAG: c-type cytochrome [Chitinophagaceae bacterium]